MKHPKLTAALVTALALPLAACTSNSTAENKDGAIAVTSSDQACELSTDTAPSGNVVFDVRNDGSKVTEFYLYAEDGRRIVGEVEDIGPGLTRSLKLQAPAGKYVAACKPGMTGKGIRHDFTVTDSGNVAAGPAGVDQQTIVTANAQYAAYVRHEADQLLAGTKRLVGGYRAGDDDRARALFA